MAARESSVLVGYPICIINVVAWVIGNSQHALQRVAASCHSSSIRVQWCSSGYQRHSHLQPYNADSVSVFVPAAVCVQLVDISAQLSSDTEFFGAIPAANGKIIFVPYDADSVGVFDPAAERLQLVDFLRG